MPVSSRKGARFSALDWEIRAMLFGNALDLARFALNGNPAYHTVTKWGTDILSGCRNNVLILALFLLLFWHFWMELWPPCAF